MLIRGIPPALAALLLASCGSPQPSQPRPLIVANVCHGWCSNTGVADLEAVAVCAESSCSKPTNAVVRVNGTELTPVGSQAGESFYEGSVPVPEGSSVVLDVKLGDVTYSVRATQFSSAPAILDPVVIPPATSASWYLANPNTLSWTPGAPTAGASYEIGFSAGPGGDFLFMGGGTVPITTTSIESASVALPGNMFLAGSGGLVGIGIGTANPVTIPNTAAQSGLRLSLYSQPVPLTFQ